MAPIPPAYQLPCGPEYLQARAWRRLSALVASIPPQLGISDAELAEQLLALASWYGTPIDTRPAWADRALPLPGTAPPQ